MSEEQNEKGFLVESVVSSYVTVVKPEGKTKLLVQDKELLEKLKPGKSRITFNKDGEPVLV